MKTFKINSNCDNLPLEVSIEIPKKEIKGIIQISHGMAEHKERYYPFMKFLAENGYVSIIHDHRGHGKSIKSLEDQGYFYEHQAEFIIEDLKIINQYIKEQYPNQKLILFGHSMGSLVVRKFIQKYDNEIDALIVCGSPSKNPFVKIAKLIVRIEKIFHDEKYRSNFIQELAFGSYDKKFKEGKNAWICQNQETVKKYNEDKDCGFIFTLNGFENLFNLMDDVYQKKNYHVTKENLPILFIAGSDDPVIINKKKWINSQKFLKSIGYQQINHILYQEMRHEILNELENKKIFYDILEWVKNNGNRN